MVSHIKSPQFWHSPLWGYSISCRVNNVQNIQGFAHIYMHVCPCDYTSTQVPVSVSALRTNISTYLISFTCSKRNANKLTADGTVSTKSSVCVCVLHKVSGGGVGCILERVQVRVLLTAKITGARDERPYYKFSIHCKLWFASTWFNLSSSYYES
jgi:hypothetical protein